MRTALWYSLGWISIGLEGVRRPSLFTAPDKSCREEGLNLDWFPLRVLRAVSAEGAPSLALLKVRDGRFIETSVCYRWGARTKPELHRKLPGVRRQQHRAAPLAAPGSSSCSWEGLCIALHLVLQQISRIPQNFRKSRFRRIQTIHSTFFFCPTMCSLQNLLSLVVGVLNISVPWNAFPRLHRGWAVQSAPFS